MTSRNWVLAAAAAIVLIALGMLLACGRGSSSQTSVVKITLSDPSTCSAPEGPFSNIYVTIVDVQIHTSATAGDNDPGWQSAIPDKKGTPQQVDLLGIADNFCFLQTLGSNTQLQPGSYQQIRVILGDNSHLPTPNACGNSANFGNCVMLTADPNKTPHPLLLSSETRTGIKIPSGQIAGGNFTIDAGQTRDLNIDFNACASIVTQGNGGYRLKPVLHAGEVSLTANSINGTIVNGADPNLPPITNANIVVALETNVNGTEVVKRQTTADASGHFSFCPVDELPSGTYDVVAVAIDSNNVAYAATITTGVAPGTALGNVKMYPAAAPAIINGQVTTNVPTNPDGVDVALSAIQGVTIGSSTVNFFVPLAKQGAVSAPLSIDSAQGCPPNTFCKSYTMEVPAANPTVGAFSVSGTNYQAGSGTATYAINAQATVPKSSGTPDCLPDSNKTTPTFTVTAGQPTTAPTINFTGCQ